MTRARCSTRPTARERHGDDAAAAPRPAADPAVPTRRDPTAPRRPPATAGRFGRRRGRRPDVRVHRQPLHQRVRALPRSSAPRDALASSAPLPAPPGTASPSRSSLIGRGPPRPPTRWRSTPSPGSRRAPSPRGGDHLVRQLEWQRALSGGPGSAQSRLVTQVDGSPTTRPPDTLAVTPDCAALYLATGDRYEPWVLVAERAHRPRGRSRPRRSSRAPCAWRASSPRRSATSSSRCGPTTTCGSSCATSSPPSRARGSASTPRRPSGSVSRHDPRPSSPRSRTTPGGFVANVPYTRRDLDWNTRPGGSSSTPARRDGRARSAPPSALARVADLRCATDLVRDAGVARRRRHRAPPAAIERSPGAARPLRIAVLAWRDLDHPEAGGSEVYVHEVTTRWARDGHDVTARHGAPARTARATRCSTGVRHVARGWSAVGVPARTRLGRPPPGAGSTPSSTSSTASRSGHRWPGRARHRRPRPPRAPAPVAHHLPGLARAARAGSSSPGSCRGSTGGSRSSPSPAPPGPTWRPDRRAPGVGDRRPQRAVGPASLRGASLRRSRASSSSAGSSRTSRSSTSSRPPPGCAAAHPALRGRRRRRRVVARPSPVADARELGVGDLVTFHGHVDDEARDRLLARAWVMVLPSVTEGWGIAVTEAAAQGTPTIGYRSSGGLTESVTDGVTGWLVDDLDGLVDARGRRALRAGRPRGRRRAGARERHGTGLGGHGRDVPGRRAAGGCGRARGVGPQRSP